jgi:hypothetical protein
MAMKCPSCGKKCRDHIDFLKHLEDVNKNSENCGCGKGGGRCISGGSKDFVDVFEKAKKRIEKAEADMQMNAIAYGLSKKEIDKVPIVFRDKVKNLVLENEYLKGMLKAQEKQLIMMRKMVDKCINKA